MLSQTSSSTSSSLKNLYHESAKLSRKNWHRHFPETSRPKHRRISAQSPLFLPGHPVALRGLLATPESLISMADTYFKLYSLARVFQFGYNIICVHDEKYPRLRWKPNEFTFAWTLSGLTLQRGFPMALQQLVVSLGLVFIPRAVNSMGPHEKALLRKEKIQPWR